MSNQTRALAAGLAVFLIAPSAGDEPAKQAAIQHEQDAELSAALGPLVAAHEGEVAIAIEQIGGPAAYYYRADEPMPTASLIKFPVLLTVHHLAAEGRIDLKTPVTLYKKDKVPGSGILTDHFSEGTTIPLHDAVHLMIVFSDNTATNLVLDEIGIPATTEYMKSLGFPETRLNAKVYRGSTTSIDPERTEQFGLGSTTAREMARLYVLFERGELACEQPTEEMRQHLLACEDERKLARSLSEGIPFAHKTGSVDDARCDAGIIYFPEATVAVCVLTNLNQDESWGDHNAAEILCGRIGKIIAERFAAP